MASYRRVYDSRHLQADCQEPGSAPEPNARKSSTGYLYLPLIHSSQPASVRLLSLVAYTTIDQLSVSVNWLLLYAGRVQLRWDIDSISDWLTYRLTRMIPMQRSRAGIPGSRKLREPLLFSASKPVYENTYFTFFGFRKKRDLFVIFKRLVKMS